MLDHIPQNWLIPAIAFTVSVIGSFLGLSFASRARRAKGPIRWQWLALASLALGGMALWSMHFIAMMGFSPPGMAIRYDAVLTMVSGLISIVVMAVALTLTILRRKAVWLLLSGFIAGTGIVVMHYTGMYSMNMHGEMHHDPRYIALACAIALVAATVALWFASRLRGFVAITAASVAMGVAVTSMHYTAMMGVHVTEPAFTRGTPDGSSAPDLLLPLIVGLFVFLLICSLFLLLGVEEERPDYSRRPARTGPPEAEGEREATPAGYSPRHATGAQPALPAHDVWTRRR